MSFVIIVLVLLGVIFVHELGHFLAARLVGVPVTRFSIGFGPSLIAREWRGTTYAVSLLPIGGYVQFATEDGESALESRPFWKKAVVTAAGVAMNLLTTVILLTILLSTGGTLTVESGQAYESVAFEGRPPVEAFLAAVAGTGRMLAFAFTALPGAVASVFASLFGSPEHAQLVGPVGIVETGSRSVEFGAVSLMYFAAIISGGLAALNILPIAPLDGGHLARYAVEAVIRRPLPRAAAAIWNNLGIVLMLALFASVMYLDIVRLLS